MSTPLTTRKPLVFRGQSFEIIVRRIGDFLGKAKKLNHDAPEQSQDISVNIMRLRRDVLSFCTELRPIVEVCIDGLMYYEEEKDLFHDNIDDLCVPSVEEKLDGLLHRARKLEERLLHAPSSTYVVPTSDDHECDHRKVGTSQDRQKLRVHLQSILDALQEISPS